MANGVTPNGWEKKDFDALLTEMADAAKAAYGDDFATTPDSVFGQLSNIVAAALTDLWDLGQAITDSQNRDAAEGIYLDYLANLVGINRLPASGSTGILIFTGDNGTVISSNFPVADDDGRNVLTQSELTLDSSNCYQSTFSVSILENNTEYSISAEGNTYSYTSDADATVAEIIQGLFAALDLATEFTTQNINDEQLLLTYESEVNLLTTTNSFNLNLDSVGGIVVGEAAITGPLFFPTNTITTIVGSNTGISSVTNPNDFNEGRNQETDEELRQN